MTVCEACNCSSGTGCSSDAISPNDTSKSDVTSTNSVKTHNSSSEEACPYSGDVNPSNLIPNDLNRGDEVPLGLSTGRVISSIPRADTEENWKYPSQEQFYKAMKRKGWKPESQDMPTVVTMHNIVNEQTWREILKWESKLHPNECNEPIKLKRFRGQPDKKSPKAIFRNWILGQEAPFDRHDWTIDRCGCEVKYVIDFYRGRAVPPPAENGKGNEHKAMAAPVAVFLDVRPALDSWSNAWDRVKMTFYDISKSFVGK